MKKCCLILALLVLLSGCTAAQTFETLGNVSHQSPTQGPLQQVVLELPEDAAAPAWESDQETMYECEGYTISRQTLPSGNLSATVRALSGYEMKNLKMIESISGDCRRYDWVWTAAGGEGDVICRGAVLDDGNYHYCLCVSASALQAGELQQEWNGLFSSFHLEN